MGTPVAFIWAMIYFMVARTAESDPQTRKKMPPMKKIVDDIYAIVLVRGKDEISREEWEEFKYNQLLLNSQMEC